VSIDREKVKEGRGDTVQRSNIQKAQKQIEEIHGQSGQVIISMEEGVLLPTRVAGRRTVRDCEIVGPEEGIHHCIEGAFHHTGGGTILNRDCRFLC